MDAAKSYASDHVPGGYNDRVISEATIAVAGQIAERMTTAAELFSDSDTANDKLAYAQLMACSDLLRQLTQVHWVALDGNRTQAKRQAKALKDGGTLE